MIEIPEELLVPKDIIIMQIKPGLEEQMKKFGKNVIVKDVEWTLEGIKLKLKLEQ